MLPYLIVAYEQKLFFRSTFFTIAHPRDGFRFVGSRHKVGRNRCTRRLTHSAGGAGCNYRFRQFQTRLVKRHRVSREALSRFHLTVSSSPSTRVASNPRAAKFSPSMNYRKRASPRSLLSTTTSTFFFPCCEHQLRSALCHGCQR